MHYTRVALLFFCLKGEQYGFELSYSHAKCDSRNVSPPLPSRMPIANDLHSKMKRLNSDLYQHKNMP